MKLLVAVLAAVAVAVVLPSVASAAATARVAGDLPTVRLQPPSSSGQRRAAQRARVRVLVEARDCSARPTVTVVASWRGRSGPAALEVSGVERVLALSPRPASSSGDRIAFGMVRVVRGVARVRAVLVTDWRHAARGRERCQLLLPRLVGAGASGSAAERGLVRLRAGVDVQPPIPTPQRVNATDHIWVCGEASNRGAFDCGVRVAAGFAPSTARPVPAPFPFPRTVPEATTSTSFAITGRGEHSGGAPTWAQVLLGVLTALTAVAIGIGAAKRSKPAAAAPASWDEMARAEYARPDEPIAARAADLTKIGAPVAAFIAPVLAAVGGLVIEASPDARAIGGSIVVAVSVAGLFYVFATDFRTRAAVAVARLQTLAVQASAEAQVAAEATAQAATAVAQAEARAESDVALARAAAAKRERDAERREAEAGQLLDEAEKLMAKAVAAQQAADRAAAKAGGRSKKGKRS